MYSQTSRMMGRFGARLGFPVARCSQPATFDHTPHTSIVRSAGSTTSSDWLRARLVAGCGGRANRYPARYGYEHLEPLGLWPSKPIRFSERNNTVMRASWVCFRRNLSACVDLLHRRQRPANRKIRTSSPVLYKARRMPHTRGRG